MNSNTRTSDNIVYYNLNIIIVKKKIYGKTKTNKIFEKSLNCASTEFHDIILLFFVQFLREIDIHIYVYT